MSGLLLHVYMWEIALYCKVLCSYKVNEYSRGARTSESPMASWLLAPVVTAISIVVAIALYLVSRERREMSYLISSSYKLLSLEEEESITKNIQILFKSKEVRNPHLVVMQIGNTGNKPIETKDFSTPLSIAFGDGASVVDCEIVKEETKPRSLYTAALKAMKAYPDRVEISPILMNPGERVAIKTLVSGFQDLTVDARIAHVSEISERDTLKPHRVARGALDIADMVAPTWIFFLVLTSFGQPRATVVPASTLTVAWGLIYGIPTQIVIAAPAIAYAVVRIAYWIIRRLTK